MKIYLEDLEQSNLSQEDVVDEELIVLEGERTLKERFEIELEMFLRRIKFDRSISQWDLTANLWSKFSMEIVFLTRASLVWDYAPESYKSRHLNGSFRTCGTKFRISECRKGADGRSPCHCILKDFAGGNLRLPWRMN